MPRTLLLFALLASLSGCGRTSTPAPALQVFAAASLQEVATELGEDFGKREEVRVEHNFAGSNVLSQQILATPRADVFLSADERWIDELVASGRVAPEDRQPWLGNRLILVGREDGALRPGSLRDLATSQDLRNLVVADEAVPAGRYARRILRDISHESAGDLWSALAPKTIPTADVRAVLGLVAADSRNLGIVYATDLAAAPALVEWLELPPPDPPIRYGAAVPTPAPNPALGRRFLDYLDSDAARTITRRHGFLEVDRS